MKRTSAVINLSAIVMVASLLVVANTVAYANGGIIDTFLSKSSIIIDDQTTEALTQGKALAKEIQGNGTVSRGKS